MCCERQNRISYPCPSEIGKIGLPIAVNISGCMGLLDDLKQQAESLRQKQQETEQVTEEGRNQRLQLAQAKLNDALHYWVELFYSLNVIKPVIPRDYYLEGGAIKLESLMQCDYR